MSRDQYEKSVDRKTGFQGQLIKVHVDTVRLPNRKLSRREVVEHGESVSIVPIREDMSVLLVKQYRHAVQQILLEIPAGGINKTETPLEAAHRELKEETGVTADNMMHLASFWTTPGFCDERMHAYLATSLHTGKQEQEDDENIEIIRVPLKQIIPIINNGKIVDSKSIAALLLSLRHFDSID